jgi:type VI secretion system secreted protein VgrG
VAEGPGLTFDQTKRILKLEVDGEVSNTLIPVQFHGREGVSELHSYIVDFVSTETSLSPDAMLGHKASLILTSRDIERKFTGLVSRFSPGPMWGRQGLRSYQLELVPHLWLATLNARCRSFVSQTAIDAVKTVFSEYTISPDGSPGRPTRDYCLQYCESDFNFISRLLEQEGVFYYFALNHDNNSIVLVDGENGTFSIDDEQLKVGPHEWITAWSQEFRTIPQGVTFVGYDFEQYAVVTNKTSAIKKLNYASAAQIEAYPSNVQYEQRSDFFSQKHMELREQDYETYRGSSVHPKMAPGGRFMLSSQDDVPAAGKSVMVLEVQHYATDYTHLAGEGGPPEYSNHFRCCPLDTKYRPPHRAQVPVVYGPQTAKVVGDPDKYGRIKVKYHWGNELESWWARIAMPWAHKSMGFQFLPRDGSEVVIEFLEGNPERPIIVGSVFNGVNEVIYSLPDNKTQSGMRGTDPSKTGAPEGLNELQFEDKAGDEFIKFFAKKDFTRVVVNDDSLEVREGKRDVVIKKGNLTTTLEQGNETRELKQGNLELKLDMGNQSTKLSMGNQTTKLDLGAASTEAMQSIELKVGQNSIKIDQMGVTINGMMISIQGQVQTQIKGTMTQINGDAMLQLSGGIMMIG